MKKILVLLIVLPGLITSCKHDEPAAPVEIFSMVVDARYSLSKDNWVFIHDANGVILDAQQTNKAGTYTFRSANTISNNKIGVTIFTYDSASGLDPTIQSYKFNSFLQIPTGQQWNLNYPIFSSPQNGVALVGYCSAKVTQVTNPVMEVLSNNIREDGYPDFNGDGGFTNYIPAKLPEFIFSVATNDDIRYQIFNDVKAGDNFAVDYTMMKSFDDVLVVAIPTGGIASANVYSIDHPTDPPSSYFLYNYGPDYSPPSPLRLGFLDQFQTYHVNVSVQFPTYGYEYQKSGPRPDNIVIPDQSVFKITNTSFLTYTYSGDMKFAYRTSAFSDVSGAVSWKVWGPAGTDIIRQLPPALAKKYPDVDLTVLKHTQTSFSTLPSTTWSDFINNRWITLRDPDADAEEARMIAF